MTNSQTTSPQSPYLCSKLSKHSRMLPERTESSCTRFSQAGTSAQLLFEGFGAFDRMDPIVLAPTRTPYAIDQGFKFMVPDPRLFVRPNIYSEVALWQGKEMCNLRRIGSGAFAMALRTLSTVQQIFFGNALKCISNFASFRLTYLTRRWPGMPVPKIAALVADRNLLTHLAPSTWRHNGRKPSPEHPESAGQLGRCIAVS